LELKWCPSPNDIWMCLFDIAKTALAVSSNLADAGYVVAGAPLIEWRRNPQVSELFDDGEFIPSRVRDEYEKPWAFLLKGAKLARPGRLPSKITTRRVAAVAIHTAAGDWELRVARVVPEATEFTEFDESGWPAATTTDHDPGPGIPPPPADSEGDPILTAPLPEDRKPQSREGDVVDAEGNSVGDQGFHDGIDDGSWAKQQEDEVRAWLDARRGAEDC
jgi:hypothetical protein